MTELRVTIDEKFNKLLDSIVESGLFHSKAELVRSATIHFLLQMGILKDFIEERRWRLTNNKINLFKNKSVTCADN